VLALQDIAAVRDAVLDAAGNTWQGARSATVDVMSYQYGEQVAAVTAESCDTVEGIANMSVAMKYAQPTQVRYVRHHKIYCDVIHAKDLS
jgi:hypothetical protein